MPCNPRSHASFGGMVGSGELHLGLQGSAANCTFCVAILVVYKGQVKTFGKRIVFPVSLDLPFSTSNSLCWERFGSSQVAAEQPRNDEACGSCEMQVADIQRPEAILAVASSPVVGALPCKGCLSKAYGVGHILVAAGP